MYKFSKLIVICLTIFLIRIAFAEDTLFVDQLTYIDSSTRSFQIGVRAMIVDNSNNANFFYVARGSDSDFVYLTHSNDLGQNWSTPEIISIHKHPVNNKYYAQGPTASLDDDGNFHVVYPYRGTPLYISGFNNYPPTHINYVTNESGNWVTLVDIINDSTIQASEGNGATVSYLYWPVILSKNNLEYFVALDYAWWSTKSHVVYSERSVDGIWSEGSALVTYEREAIDKYTINCATIVTDATNIYSLWFNRYTGELKAKTNSAGVWGTNETIYTSSNAVDGEFNSYLMSSISGNGKCQVVMSRMENSWNYKELFFLEKDGSNWLVDKISIPDSLNSVTAFEKNDTTNIFYRYYTHYPNLGYKVLKHTDSGFSVPTVISFGDSISIYNIIVAEHNSTPIVYQYYDVDKAMWYLCSGEGSNIMSGIEDSKIDITEFILSQNYPNPFNPLTTIEYNIPQNNFVKITIYNLRGEKIKTLVNENKIVGNYSVVFDGSNFSSGIYFYRIEAGNYSNTKKLVLMK